MFYDKICEYCRNEFKTIYKKARFCSRRCKGHICGRNKIPWNKGLTKENNFLIARMGKNSGNSRLGIKLPYKKRTKLSENHKNKISKGLSNMTLEKRLETNKKMSESMKGRKLSNETKRNMRIATLNRIEKYRGKLQCFVGNCENQLLNEQEQKDNCKILRQYRINDLGYIVDGYCKENNTVYEVYEPKHDKQIEHDLQRQKEICNKLSCNFIILRSKK